MKRPLRSKVILILLTLVLSLLSNAWPGLASDLRDATARVPGDQSLRVSLAYPPDPTDDIPWIGGFDVSNIEAAFNNARSVENSQLGTTTAALTMPSQATWDAMDDGERALWLINRERIDRGVMALHGAEENVTSVAQTYAEFLLDNDLWGHDEDGNSPWERLNLNPAIGDCHDFLSVAENLAVFVTSGSSIALPIERSIYMWMYEDKGSSWGHRHATLWYPYNDNGGPSGMEGFLGIGRANGGPYQGPFSQPWNFAEMIVMNVFDPCASWDYSPRVTSIKPSWGENNNTIHISDLTGTDFDASSVQLTRAGVTPIEATNETVVNESKITCDLDLSGAATGTWDVVVTNGDGLSGTLIDGFFITVPLDEATFLPLVISS